MRRVADKGAGTVTEVLLVIDATTGQNGLVQAEQFTEAADLTGVVLTKLDGSAKGGIVFAIQSTAGYPRQAGRSRRRRRRPGPLRRRRVRGGTVLMILHPASAAPARSSSCLPVCLGVHPQGRLRLPAGFRVDGVGPLGARCRRRLPRLAVPGRRASPSASCSRPVRAASCASSCRRMLERWRRLRHRPGRQGRLRAGPRPPHLAPRPSPTCRVDGRPGRRSGHRSPGDDARDELGRVAGRHPGRRPASTTALEVGGDAPVAD